MSLSSKILLSIIAVLLLAIGGLALYMEFEHKAQLDQINKSMVAQQQLIDGITRSQSKLVSKSDLDAYGKQLGINLSAIQDNLNGLNAQIEGINDVQVISTGQQGTNVSSTTIVKDPTAPPLQPGEVDQFGYLSNTQTLQLNEDFANNMKVPFGSVSFDAWKSTPWNFTILPRNYNVISTIGSDADGRHYVYNKMTIKSGDQTYTLPIQTAQFEEVLPSASFSFFNPRLFLGIAGGADIYSQPISGKITPNIDIDIMSYGKLKSSPALSILGLGIGPGFSEGQKMSAEFILTPIKFNLGKEGVGIPLINNTYVAPSIQVSGQGHFTPALNISVGL